jgi:steroid delta-isomerase-like uncharacterized protein
MAISENKAVARRYLEQAWGRGELGTIDALCAPTMSVFVHGRPKGIHGTRVVKELVTSVRAIFPDLSLEVQQEVAEEETVVVRWRSTGTQRGEFTKGIPPTGERVSWSGVSIFRIVDGKIQEERVEEDLLDLQEQIGVIEKAEPG